MLSNKLNCTFCKILAERSVRYLERNETLDLQASEYNWEHHTLVVYIAITKSSAVLGSTPRKTIACSTVDTPAFDQYDTFLSPISHELTVLCRGFNLLALSTLPYPP